MKSHSDTTRAAGQPEVPGHSADPPLPAFLELQNHVLPVWRQPVWWLAVLTVIPLLASWVQSPQLLSCLGFGLLVMARFASRRAALAGPVMIVGLDGKARLAGQPGQPAPLIILFAWQGHQSARLVFRLPSGGSIDWFISRGRLGDAQWRCLSAWLGWLARAQVNSGAQ